MKEKIILTGAIIMLIVALIICICVPIHDYYNSPSFTLSCFIYWGFVSPTLCWAIYEIYQIIRQD